MWETRKETCSRSMHRPAAFTGRSRWKPASEAPSPSGRAATEGWRLISATKRPICMPWTRNPGRCYGRSRWTTIHAPPSRERLSCMQGVCTCRFHRAKNPKREIRHILVAGSGGAWRPSTPRPANESGRPIRFQKRRSPRRRTGPGRSFGGLLERGLERARHRRQAKLAVLSERVTTTLPQRLGIRIRSLPST